MYLFTVYIHVNIQHQKVIFSITSTKLEKKKTLQNIYIIILLKSSTIQEELEDKVLHTPNPCTWIKGYRFLIGLISACQWSRVFHEYQQSKTKKKISIRGTVFFQFLLRFKRFPKGDTVDHSSIDNKTVNLNLHICILLNHLFHSLINTAVGSEENVIDLVQ